MYIMYFTILASLSCTLKHLSQFLTLHVIERDHSSQISYNVEIGFAYFPLGNLQDSLAFCTYKRSSNYKFLSFFRLPFVMVSAANSEQINDFIEKIDNFTNTLTSTNSPTYIFTDSNINMICTSTKLF
jgi:hypothetical protein